MSFTDKAVLVTGATSGIGRAAAARFSAEGRRVALVGRDRAALASTRTAMGAAGEPAITVAADVTREEDVRRAVDETVRAFGGLDVLVCGAGVIGPGASRPRRPSSGTR
jgi:NAD(P)-dependent dehydrogenase (short-subunit alcohol dehydrogenase family)